MRRVKMLIIFSALFTCNLALSSAWRPVVPAQLSTSILHQEAAVYGNAPLSSYNIEETPLPQAHLLPDEQDQCALYKVSMSQQLYFEYVQYKTDLPDLKEFTLCMWTKFHNHSNDHPLFSYAVGDQPRGILSWVANTPRSSYYMLNVDGHNLYRLNYPLRLNKWYHSCQSWNGRTGEWQIWVNDERVGRGFHNRLVGHVIKGGGIAISGQEQRQLGGGFLEGAEAPPGAGGYLGELTMVQLYNVALTAGKAHKDHKHHHAHHYEHDTTNNTPKPTTQTPVTAPPLPMHPFLTAGQLNHQVKINLGAPLQIVKNGVTVRHPILPLPKDPVPQPLPPANPPGTIPTLTAVQPGIRTRIPSYPGTFANTQFFGTPAPGLQEMQETDNTPVNGFSFIDNRYHELFKREKNLSKRHSTDKEEGTASLQEADTKMLSKRATEDAIEKVTFIGDSTKPAEKALSKRESEKNKRALLQLSDGSVVDDSFLVSQGLDNNYFTGLASFGIQLPVHKMKDEEREPAEAEVRQVMDICDGCAEEPFEKALVMSWRSVPKKLYSGALHIPAIPRCKAF